MIVNEREFRRFVAFAREHVSSGDVDPTYPVLNRVFKAKRYSEAEGLYHLFVYVSFYDLGETERYVTRNPLARALAGDLEDTTHIKKATERRGFRANDGARSMIREFLSKGLPTWKASGNGEAGWNRVRSELQTIKHCGPWAAYKWCDLLKNVMEFPITAPDLGVGGGGKNAGPIPGLSRISGKPWEVCARDLQLQRSYFDLARLSGVPFSGMEEFETSLCDYNSFAKGRYYVGHDIDAQMEALKSCGATYWEARGRCFPAKYLGELNGWFGVRKDKLK